MDQQPAQPDSALATHAGLHAGQALPPTSRVPGKSLLATVATAGRTADGIAKTTAHSRLVQQLPYAILVLRPKQWVKNGLVLLALIFAGRLTDPTAMTRTVIAFFVFSFAASTVYIFNDIGDRERDRLHPKKRERPIASGRLSIPLACGTAAVCVIAVAGLTALLVSMALWGHVAGAFGLSTMPYRHDPALLWGGSPLLFVGVILGYIVINVAYSVHLKHVVLWDVFIVAAGFVLRAFAGALVIPVPVSTWFYLCTLFLALFLALGKRRAELVQLEGAASAHRVALQGYSLALLDQLMGVVVSCTILTYSLYTFEATTANHALVVTIPFVIFGIFRYLYLVYVKSDGGQPDEVLLRDKQILGAVLLCVLVTVAALYGLPVLRAHPLAP